MKIKIQVFPILICFLAVYNIFYGAICWSVSGINGVLLGSIVMVCATIGGVLLRNCKFCETKDGKITHKE